MSYIEVVVSEYMDDKYILRCNVIVSRIAFIVVLSYMKRDREHFRVLSMLKRK